MRPVRTSNLPNTYSGKGISDEVADLPCRTDTKGTTAIFRLSSEERERVINGGFIELHVSGHPLPPVALNVTTEEVVEAWLPDDLRCNVCGAVWKEDRGLDHCGHCGSALYPAALAKEDGR